jgi:spermidine/putrescine transport system permease protein
MLVFFVVPFYVILAIAFGTLDIFQNPVPAWNPSTWKFANVQSTLKLVVSTNELQAGMASTFIRTFVYVFIATVILLAVAYPVAYYVARFGGRRKGFYLLLMIAPFWVSYLMRMLAWTNLLQTDGYVNKILEWLGLMSQSNPYAWLNGHSVTVILGLVYGYIPYLILPLFAGLDRIAQSLLEASRDLGANPVRTFIRVTLPLSKQAILAGMVIVSLPMFGDYYTSNLLSGRSNTYMIGNLIDNAFGNNRPQQAAILVLLLTILLLVPMFYYLRSTAQETART